MHIEKEKAYRTRVYDRKRKHTELGFIRDRQRGQRGDPRPGLIVGS